MSKEVAFSDFILSHYCQRMMKHPDLKIDAGKNILTDVTCIFQRVNFELLHGFSQTDIVIYTEQRFVPGNHELISFYNDVEIKHGVLAIPFVVLELKTGDLTTDGIRSRDFVAGRIR